MILEDLKGILENSGIFADYDYHSYFGINDEIEAFKEATNWTAFKVDGGGQVDKLYGVPMVRLWLGGNIKNQLGRYNNMQSIIDFMNANYSNGSVMNIVVQSDVMGPFPLSGNRSYFEIHLRLTQNRG